MYKTEFDRRSWRFIPLSSFVAYLILIPGTTLFFITSKSSFHPLLSFSFTWSPLLMAMCLGSPTFLFFQVLSNRIFILFFGCKRRNHFVLSSPTIKTNEDEVRLLRRSRRREGTVFCLLTHFNSMMRIRAMLKPGSYEMTFYIDHRRIESSIKHLRKVEGALQQGTSFGPTKVSH